MYHAATQTDYPFFNVGAADEGAAELPRSVRLVTGARKKVIVRRFLPGLLRGYLPPSGFVEQDCGKDGLQMLDLSGRVQVTPLQEVKAVSFVRDFNLSDDVNPERLPRRNFLARPRSEGLWIRMTLRDDEQMEGLAPLDLSLADSLADDRGIQFTPPDIRGNTVRMYVPRSAITLLQVVAVVTTPTRRKALEALPRPAGDGDQFVLALKDDGREVAP